MYVKKSCRIHDKIEIEKHYDGRFGAPGMPRQPKKKKTPEEMAKQNFWRRCRELRRIIELNFGEGDWHVTLTCRKDERPSQEEAVKIIRAFRDKLRAAYKKQEWELKYVISCETGERGAVHWHMIINNMHNQETSTASIIRKLWARGRPYFSPLDGSGDYKALAEYIIKESSRRMEKEETIEKLSYMVSRNLKRPVVREEKIPASRWSRKPRAPEGWYLVEESLVNGFNKFTGLPYQYYTIRRKEEQNADSRRLYRDGPERTGKRNRKSHVCHVDKVKKRKRERKQKDSRI